MEYIIVAAVIGIIAICGFIGREKGLVKIVLSMVATVLAMFLSSILTTPITEFLKEKLGVVDKIKEIVLESMKDIKIDDVSYLEDLQLPDVIKDKIIDGVQGLEIPVKDYVIESMATIALSAIVFLVVFAIATVAISIAISVLDIIAKLPLIKQANRGAGLVAGLVYGVVVVWVAMIVLTALSSTAWASDILLIIGDNKLLSFIYDSNPIMGILANVINKL